MGEWRFLAYDLRTSAFLAELPVISWQHSDPLTGPGGFSATVDLAATLGSTTIREATRRGRTLVVAERGGVPDFTGIIWRRSYSAADRTLKIAGANLTSYFDHWSVTEALGPFTDIEQFTIFRTFVATVQAAPAGSIGLQVGAEVSGVLRERTTYEAFSGAKYGELMRALAEVQNGFEFTMAVEYNAGLIERRLRLFYPRRGRDLSATGLRFYAPGNATLFDVNEDATDMAVTVVGLGAGDGRDMLLATASQTDLLAAGWPGYRVTRAHKDVTVLATLNEHAAAEAARLSGVDDEMYTIEVDPTSVGQPYGSWTIGDDCLLVVDDDPFYPAGADGSPGLAVQRRVMQHDWTIAGSSETLRVSLGRKVIP